MKKIPNFENYFITRNGKVFSNKRGKLKELKYNTCQSGEYYRVKLSGKRYLVHRLVALTFIPNIGNLPEVNHKNGIKTDNRVENLEWITSSENQVHAYNTGLKTKPKGVLNGRHELSEKDVINIYNKLLQGHSLKSISVVYNISSTQVLRIKKKLNWNHLLCELPDMIISNKAKPLTDTQIESVKLCILENLTFKETVKKLNFLITKDQFYRVKSLVK